MIRLRQSNRSQLQLLTIIIVIFMLCNVGCTGDRVEYDPPDPNLIGKVVRFKSSVAYIILSENDSKDFDTEAIKIGRLLTTQEMVDRKYSFFSDYPHEHIEGEMLFRVVGSYWVRQGLIDKEFASDIHKIILKDKNNIQSVCSMLFLENNGVE